MHHKMRHTQKKIQQRLELIEPLIYRRRATLPSFKYQPLPDPVTPPDVGLHAADSGWQVIEPTDYWAKPRTNFIMRSSFTVPADWSKNAPVSLYMPLGNAGDFSHPEALVYIDGESIAACDRHHQEVRLPEKFIDGKQHVLALHGWTGNYNRNGWDARLQMRACEVVQIDQPTRDFSAAARAAIGIANELDAAAPARYHLLNALEAAFNLLETQEPLGGSYFYDSVAAASKALRDGIKHAGVPLDVEITAAGHAHIDIAWLWTLDQVRRKSGRTFHTVNHLMNEFPDYQFSQSQPQLYDYIRQDYPQLFEAIKKRVAEQRWEPMGGMWVEADCNLSGAESLVRQFLLGRNFYREHFGKGSDTPVLWLPDVFGYSWAMPQLMKLSGINYFMTIKIGWSQYNRLPYDSFWWQGIDGTKILTHFSTTPEIGSAFASTYNADVSPAQVYRTWTNFQQKEHQKQLLMSYGYGDGGGGPTREMLENIREMGDFPGTPQIHHGTVKEFFEKMDAESGAILPSWNGELYLELHRGTYTTQGRNKRANRKSEFALHDAEFLASLATVSDSGFAYPAADMDKAWKLVCLNQFHDIIPGSSITEVYIDSQKQYEEIFGLAHSARDNALATIGQQTGGDVLVVNPTSFTQSGMVRLAEALPANKHLATADGKIATTQRTDSGTYIQIEALAPFSVTPLKIADGSEAAASGQLTATPTLLENAFVRVELNAAGDITRIYDKTYAREVLPEGRIAAQYQAFEDRPVNWDAWDIDIFYDDKMWTSDAATSVKVVESGALVATLEIERRIFNSSYTQRISLRHDSPQITFEDNIDWQERHVLLKVAFPVDILSPVATYEIQWGNVQRPTHRNTSWDWARFEVCAQKWVDLSEGNYGVSVINDCKYGHDTRDNVMRISLLRSPTEPDPVADVGKHTFAYSILPHGENWQSGTIQAAYTFNDPLIAVKNAKPSGSLKSTALVNVDQSNVVIETIKRAEDSSGIIVRLYETQRKRVNVKISAGFKVASASITNLLEEDVSAAKVEGGAVSLEIKPFQIVTLKLVPAK